MSRVRNGRNYRGSALFLIIATMVILAIIGIFCLNYCSLFMSHKEAQTAIDAAALQAAKDMSRIVVSTDKGTYFGNVALVDDSPPQGDINNRPVVGINTIMATIRLDALIANELGNSSMVVMAAQDLRRAEHDAQLLQQEILKAANGGIAKDKNGETINLVAAANAAYDANTVRSINGAKRLGNVVVKVGTTTNRILTNTPVPEPVSSAQINGTTSQTVNGKTVYNAGVDVPTTVVGKTLSFRFIPVSDGLALVENNTFKELSGDHLPPSLVQVEADEQVGLANGHGAGSGHTDLKTVHVMATAEAGAPYMPKAFPSGTMQVSFPGVGAPPANQGIDFTSIKTIMNSSQVSLNDAKYHSSTPDLDSNFGTDSPYVGWNGASKGNWFSALGGAFPSDANASIETAAFRGRKSDDPSVVLSFTIYDWLRSMYLRPNIKDAAAMLSAPLWDHGQPAVALNTSLIPAAYAEMTPDRPVTFGIFNIPKNGVGDRRDLRDYKLNREGFRRQLPNVFGYLAADMTLPGNSLVVSMDDRGRTTTTNGEPAEILFDFYHSVKRTNKIAGQSLAASRNVVVSKVAELKQVRQRLNMLPEGEEKDKLKQDRKTIIAQLGRAIAVNQNAQYSINMTLSMLNDRKAITSFGLKKHGNKNFEMVTGNFYPLSKAATEAEILSLQPIATNQDASLPVRDWASLSGDKSKSFALLSSSGQVRIGHNKSESNLHFLAPAHAMSSIPPSKSNIFALYINTDGHMVRTNPMTPVAGPNILEGQYMYQNTASWITKAPGSSISLIWNCVGRDNGAVYTKAYFADRNAAGNNGSVNASGYPMLIGEWSLRCPAPTSGPIPTTPEDPPTTQTNPPSTPQTTPDSPSHPSTPPSSPTGETPQTPPISNNPSVPTTPGNPETPTSQNPDFCVESNGPVARLTVLEGDSSGSVVARVDDAGNVTYYMRDGQEQLHEMHFVQDFNTWKQGATLKESSVRANSLLKANTFLDKMDEQELLAYFQEHGSPITSVSGLAAGDYSMDRRNNTDDIVQNMIDSAYNTALYYFNEGGCAQLFNFST